MRFQDLCEKIKSGEIKLDLFGHKPHGPGLIEGYERTLVNANGAGDGKWSSSGASSHGKTEAEWDAQMRLHFQRKLDNEIAEGEMICWVCDNNPCGACAKRLYYILQGDTLRLCARFGATHKDPDIIETSPCEYATPKITQGEIKIASNMVFANFFRSIEDHPEGYQEEYNINYDIGIANVTKYKAERNVAYGQMSNMSVGVFVHPEKKSIIIGDPYIADHRIDEILDPIEDEAERDKKYEELDHSQFEDIDGHKLVGTICCDVWRWEATDMLTVGEEVAKVRAKEDWRDVIELEVPHGIWQFEHYFESQQCPKPEIYSRLWLKP